MKMMLLWMRVWNVVRHQCPSKIKLYAWIIFGHFKTVYNLRTLKFRVCLVCWWKLTINVRVSFSVRGCVLWLIGEFLHWWYVWCSTERNRISKYRVVLCTWLWRHHLRSFVVKECAVWRKWMFRLVEAESFLHSQCTELFTPFLLCGDGKAIFHHLWGWVDN